MSSTNFHISIDKPPSIRIIRFMSVFRVDTGERSMSRLNGNGREWSTSELADALGISLETVNKMIKDGQVAARRRTFAPRSRWVITDAEARRVIAEIQSRTK